MRLPVRPVGMAVLLFRCCIPPRQYFYFQEVLAAKQCIMQANAELHQSVLAKQKKRFGEEISRLQVRLRHFLISMFSARTPSYGVHTLSEFTRPMILTLTNQNDADMLVTSQHNFANEKKPSLCSLVFRPFCKNV